MWLFEGQRIGGVGNTKAERFGEWLCGDLRVKGMGSKGQERYFGVRPGGRKVGKSHRERKVRDKSKGKKECWGRNRRAMESRVRWPGVGSCPCEYFWNI